MVHGPAPSVRGNLEDLGQFAHAVSNPKLSPHLEFVDMGGHGYATVRSPAMKCGPSSSAFHDRSCAAIVRMAVLFATGSSTWRRSGNRASGLCCASNSLRAIPAFRSDPDLFLRASWSPAH